MANLIKYDAMCRAIHAAYQIDEVKDIRDKAKALEVYSRQAKNTEAERQCCEIRLRAERKWRALYDKTEKAKGARGNPGGRGATIVWSGNATAQTLKELGITKQQASDWKKLAEIPDDKFEELLARPGVHTTAGIIEAANTVPAPVEPVSHEALWLWGRLRDFERDGWFEKDRNEVLRTMTNQMREDVMRLAPMVARWLMEV